ncbi:MAG: beta-lactamase family protein [Flavobacteriales bacterium]|nr:beta-lactamase family protein [Flavobacteriales bacterium]
MRLSTVLSLVLFSAFLACSNDAPETVAADPPVDPLVARIDSFMQRNQRAGFAGSLLVMRDGKAVIDKGYGLRDREQNLPNTPTTVHAIGSITKQFTAACILKLQEQGKLDVKDLMSKYIANVPADKAAITLHQLLTHSAGFPGAIGDDNEPIDGEDFTLLAMKTPLEFAPGTGYAYSNVGYSLLGIIVEIVGGVGYERFLHDALLAPAGVTHTGYRIPDWSKEELAIGYRKDGTRWGTMLDHPLVNGGPGWHLRANGGILSTTHDMYDWVQALASNKVFSKASTEQMFAPHVAEGEGSDSHYGYGWAIFKTQRNTRLITHNGGNGIQFADVLWYADEGLTVVLMSNANKRGMQDIAWHVGHMCFDPSFEPPVPQDAKTLDGPPAGPVGDRMKALSAIIGSAGDDAELTGWLKDNLGPGFFEDFPLERHLTVFKELRRDIGPNTIETVQQLGAEEFEVKLRAQRDQGLFRIIMQLRPSDARIAGLSVEKE